MAIGARLLRGFLVCAAGVFPRLGRPVILCLLLLPPRLLARIAGDHPVVALMSVVGPLVIFVCLRPARHPQSRRSSRRRQRLAFLFQGVRADTTIALPALMRAGA